MEAPTQPTKNRLNSITVESLRDAVIMDPKYFRSVYNLILLKAEPGQEPFDTSDTYQFDDFTIELSVIAKSENVEEKFHVPSGEDELPRRAAFYSMLDAERIK